MYVYKIMGFEMHTQLSNHYNTGWYIREVYKTIVVIGSHTLPPISCVLYSQLLCTYTSVVYWKEQKCLILERYNHTFV